MLIRRFCRFIQPRSIKPQRLFLTAINHLSAHLTKRPQFNFTEFDLGKHKAEAKQFYEKEVQSITEVSKIEEWDQFVMKAETPVVLDCYADWCQPCKKLTPVLQAKAKGAKNWKLVKLNIDKFPQIANMLQLKTVPTVYLVVNGKSIDGFTGMPDDKILSGFFGTLDKILIMGEQGEKQAAKFDKGRLLVREGKWDEAETVFQQLLKDKLVAQLQPITRLLLAQCYTKLKKITKYEETISHFKTTYKKQLEAKGEEFDMLRAFVKELDQQYQALKIQPLKDDKLEILNVKIKDNPSDLHSKFELATVYQQKQMLEEAIQVLLEIIKIDRNWEEKKANKQLLEIFKKLGQSSSITNKYRKIYQRMLY